MPKIWGKLTFRPNLCYFATFEKNWLREEDRWKILLGQRGSETSLGHK